MKIGENGGVIEIKDGGKHALEKLVKSYQGIGGAVSASLIAKKLREDYLTENLDLPEKIEERL